MTGVPEVSALSFDLRPSLDRDALREVFRGRRRLHVKELLPKASAEALYHELAGDIPWSTFLTADGRMYEAPPEVSREYAEEQAQALIDMAHRSARERGFGYVFDGRAPRGLPLLGRFAEVLRSEEVKAIFRRVFDLPEIARVEIQAVRLRSGHFMSFHDTLITGDKERKCRAFFSYNLTPEWRPEWGGLLSARGEEGHLVEGYAPCFNCLDVFAVPQGRWVSAVSPLAEAPAYSVSGAVYVG